MADIPMEVDASAAKKRKTMEPESSTALSAPPKKDPPAPKPTLAITDGATSSVAKQQPLLPREFERLTLSINPQYLDRLREANEVGYDRPFSRRTAKPRFYELDLKVFRASLKNVLTEYIKWKAANLGKYTSAQIQAEVDLIVPLTVDACMTALYSKQRTIHKAYGKYSSRFSTPATYSKDVELPLPFADAISNIGVFETHSMAKSHLVIPVYPEGTKHEGRASEDWSSYEYEACIPMLREYGIPVKSVDTRIKTGTAWWTFKVEFDHEGFDLKCIFPFNHYSNYAVITALMFVQRNENDEAVQIIKHLTDDEDYGYRFRELMPYEPSKTFAALCHGPSEEWNVYANV